MGEGKAKKEAPRRRLSEGACVHMAAVQERSLGCARDDEAGERMGSQGWRAIFLEDGIPYRQPSPRGEGKLVAASPRSFDSGRSCSGIRYLTYNVSRRSG